MTWNARLLNARQHNAGTFRLYIALAQTLKRFPWPSVIASVDFGSSLLVERHEVELFSQDHDCKRFDSPNTPKLFYTASLRQLARAELPPFLFQQKSHRHKMAATSELRQRHVEREASPVSFSGSTSDEDEVATFTPPNFTVRISLLGPSEQQLTVRCRSRNC